MISGSFIGMGREDIKLMTEKETATTSIYPQGLRSTKTQLSRRAVGLLRNSQGVA